MHGDQSKRTCKYKIEKTKQRKRKHGLPGRAEDQLSLSLCTQSGREQL